MFLCQRFRIFLVGTVFIVDFQSIPSSFADNRRKKILNRSRQLVTWLPLHHLYYSAFLRLRDQYVKLWLHCKTGTFKITCNLQTQVFLPVERT